MLNEHQKFYKMHAKKITHLKTYLFFLSFLILTSSCSVKNSTLKKGTEFEKKGNFKEASKSKDNDLKNRYEELKANYETALQKIISLENQLFEVKKELQHVNDESKKRVTSIKRRL